MIYFPGAFAAVTPPDVTNSQWAIFGNPSALSGIEQTVYQDALQISQGILSGAISDYTNGALYYYDISQGNPPQGFIPYMRNGSMVIYGTVGPFIYLGPPPAPIPGHP